MKKMILLFSHTLTAEQIADGKSSFGVEEFEALDAEMWLKKRLITRLLRLRFLSIFGLESFRRIG